MKDAVKNCFLFFDRNFFIGLSVYLAFVLVVGKLAEKGREFRLFVPWDAQLSEYAFSLRTEWLTGVMKFITHLGDAWFIAVLLVCLTALFFTLKKYQYLVALWLASGGAYLTSFFIKDIFARARPEGHRLIPEDGFSFPSGHAIVALAFYGILVYFLCTRVQRTRHKALIICAGTALILAIGASRIYLGVHWPSDVFASYIFGGAWLLIVMDALRKKNKENDAC